MSNRKDRKSRNNRRDRRNAKEAGILNDIRWTDNIPRTPLEILDTIEPIPDVPCELDPSLVRSGKHCAACDREECAFSSQELFEMANS